jgi:hypothetical protein
MCGHGKEILLLASLALLLLSPAFASDPPDTTINPVTGQISAVDTVVQSGVDQVRCTTKVSSNLREVDLLGHPDFNGHSPRIAASPSGDVFVTWWNDAPTPQVLLSVQTYPDPAWFDPVVLSDTSEDSRNPQIVHDGTSPWIAYLILDPGITDIAVTGGANGQDPWPTRTLIGLTTYTGDLDLAISAESSRLWVTWVDSESDVGWSQYDYVTATWSEATVESFANDDVEAARDRIRNAILGN